MKLDELPKLDDLVGELWSRRDVMAASTLHVMGAIEEKINEDGWDEPGHLFFFYRQMASDEQLQEWEKAYPTGRNVTGVDGFVMSAMGLTNPEGGPWFDGLDAEGAQQSLHDLAEVIKTTTPPVPTLAVVMSAEAWVVLARGKSAADYDGPAPSEHPDRVEVRMMFGVDIAGNSYFLGRDRRDEVRYAKMTQPGDASVIGDPHTDGIRVVMNAIAEARDEL